MRARIAQELDSGPTLLVLDNCEHVLEAAASLVAFLLVTTRDLQRPDHQPGAAAASRPSAPCRSPCSRPTTPAACSCGGRAAVRPDAEPRPPRPWRPSSTGWTACRSRSSSPRRACGRMSVEEVRRRAGRPVRAAAQPRPAASRAAPHPDRRDRVVVGPAQPTSERRRWPGCRCSTTASTPRPSTASWARTAWTWSRAWPTSRSSTVTEVDGVDPDPDAGDDPEFAGLRLRRGG